MSFQGITLLYFAPTRKGSGWTHLKPELLKIAIHLCIVSMIIFTQKQKFSPPSHRRKKSNQMFYALVTWYLRWTRFPSPNSPFSLLYSCIIQKGDGISKLPGPKKRTPHLESSPQLGDTTSSSWFDVHGPAFHYHMSRTQGQTGQHPPSLYPF